MNTQVERRKRYEISQQTKTLCAELFRSTPISSFTYYRLNRQNELVTIETIAELSDFYIENKHYLTDFQHRDFDHDLPQGSFFLESARGSEKEIELGKIITEKFNIANFIGISRKSGDVCEIFCFAADSNIENIQNFYLNNIFYLEKYIDVIQAPLQQIVKINNAPKIYIPPSPKIIQSHFNNERMDLPQVMKNTLAKNKTDKNKLAVKNLLTSRELDCLFYLTQGLTSKEIGSKLCLSGRTIENYCERIKSKFGCRRKQELIALYAGVFETPRLDKRVHAS